MPSFPIVGQFFDNNCAHKINSSLEKQYEPFYVFTHGMFYYYQQINNATKWVRAYLKQDLDSKACSINWEELIENTRHTSFLPISPQDIATIQKQIDNEASILDKLKSQREQFLTIQANDKSTHKDSSEASKSHENADKVYTGPLIPSQQALLKLTMIQAFEDLDNCKKNPEF